MTTSYTRKPQMTRPFVKKVTHWEFCNHWSYRNGKLQQCGAPTENGRPTCKSCREIEAQSGGQQRQENMLGLRSGRRPA